MNKGLKDYTKQLELTIGNSVKSYINLNKNDANLHIIVPLITTVGLNVIDTFLCFNLQEKNEFTDFGKGFKLNFYKKIINTNLKNFDGSIDNYDIDILNKETGLTLKKIDGLYTYKLIDKLDNSLFFNNTQNYPNLIEYKNKNKINIIFNDDEKRIDNNKGDTIKFINNNVNYYHNNDLIKSNEIVYDSNNYISKIIYKNIDEEVYSISFDFRENEIEIIEDLTDYRIKFEINDNKVTSIVDGFSIDYNYSHKTTIDYQEYYTIVTNYKNEKSYYFFDKSGLPLYEFDDDNNILETSYDNNTKSLIYNSGNINLNVIQNLLNDDLNLFENEGLILSKVEHIDDIYKNIIKGNIYKLTGTGKLVKKIPTHGLSLDNNLLLIFGKQLTISSEESYVEVELYAGKTMIRKFNKSFVDNNFQLLTLGVNANISYDYISIEIRLFGNASIEIGGLQLINKSFGGFYEYDQNNNLITSISGTNSTNYNYENNQLNTSIGVDSSFIDYTYDERGNLIEGTTQYGVNIKNEYNENNQNIKQTIKNLDESKIIETKVDYTTDNRFIENQIDELGNKTTFNDYDIFGKVKKVTSAINVITKCDYLFDENIENLTVENGNDSSKISYTYDDKKRLKEIQLSNNSNYHFNYDDIGNIIEILLNNVIILKYEYDKINGNLIKQIYGVSNEAYKFIYNEKDLITNVIYVNKNNTELNKFTYFYNDAKQLIKVCDDSNNIIYEYVYNQDNEIINIKNNDFNIANYYDNLGNVNNKKIEIYNDCIYQSFDNVSRSKGSNPASLLEAFKNYDMFIGTFEKDTKLICKNKFTLDAINHDYEVVSIKSRMEGIIPYIKIDAAHRLSYQNPRESHNDYMGCIGFWFKLDSPYPSNNRRYLLSIDNQTKRPDFIGLYIQDKNIYLKTIDMNYNEQIIITSSVEIDLNNWNFVCLNFMNRNDGYGYPDICEYALIVNGNIDLYKQKDPRLYVDCGVYPVMNIGHNFNGQDCSEDLNGRITSLMIMDRSCLPNNVVMEYFRLSKDYIIDNQLVDNSVNTVDFSSTHLFTNNKEMLNNYEIYPLQNNVISLNGKKPNSFEVRNLSIKDKDRTFNFNNISKNYAYVADGEELVYGFNQTNSGTIILQFFIDANCGKQYIFEGKDLNNNFISLYINKENKLIIKLNNREVKTNLFVSLNNWHTIGFTFEETYYQGPRTDLYINLRIKLDNRTFESCEPQFFRFTEIEFYIGRKVNYTNVVGDLGSYITYEPLFGQIQMLMTNKKYSSFSDLRNVFLEINGLTKTSSFDEFGMLRKIDLHNSESSLLSNTYFYKTRADREYISNYICMERIVFNQSLIERKYEYDAIGNVTKIIDSTFGDHVYEYDYRGFLIKSDDITYSYDANGNITRKNNIIYQYDRIIKDRLISYDGKNIEYDKENPLIIKKIDKMSFEYEGRRLVEVNTGYGTYKYIYDNQGLRIKKVDNNGKITNFIYDNNKLIYQYDDMNKLTFLYDEYDNLYGFIMNNTEKYFYIKDCLQNILGIIDINGNLIVKYDYTAYGEIVNILGDNIQLGEINPFRYKGYYFDKETNLYYCKSRYYSPELCRFISPDSIEYLSPQSINGLNLYCYCANNPIMYIDPSGHFFISALIISISVAALIGAATAGYSSYQSGERDWDLVADIAGGAVFGAAVGATIVLGGAAGLAATGASVVGFGLSTGAALGISVGATAVAGMAKYSLDCVASNENNWNFGGFVLSGVEGTLQGAATFGLAFVGGKSGLFDKLGNFRTWDAFYVNHCGMNTLRSIFLGSKVLIGETFSKALFVSGSAAIARWLIDFMIPDLY